MINIISVQSPWEDVYTRSAAFAYACIALYLCTAFLLECKIVWGTTMQQGGSVSPVSRGEWPGRRLHQRGLGDEKRGEVGKEAIMYRSVTAFKYTE